MRFEILFFVVMVSFDEVNVVIVMVNLGLVYLECG